MPDAIVDSFDLGESIEELREGFLSLRFRDSTPDRFCSYATQAAASLMRVLLDENLDYVLRNWLGGHEVATVSYMGNSLKNGEFLSAGGRTS